MDTILLSAADVLAKASTAEDMTTTAISRRSGIPVSTIYRYFADRSAIIAALIDKETAEIDTAINERLAVAETVNPSILLRLIMGAHLEHFQSQRRSVLLWFGARQSKAVSERVNERYDYLSAWILQGGIAAGFVTTAVPRWGGELIVWTCDRTFELIFREDRPQEEQQAIMAEVLDMAVREIEKYAPDGGSPTVTREAFIEAFGEYRPPNSIG